MDSTHITKISDFSDRLNPMLVKELRQGMRGIGFVSLFVGFQMLLCIILLMTAYVAAPETAGSKLSGIITTFFFIACVVVQPLRGLAALNQEIKGDTIDLLSMTRLNAWKITYGKWLSIVAQSALLLTAIIPYLILRYFFGDMQLFSEILMLITLFILSATLTAVAVGISAIPSTLVRFIFPILVLFSMISGLPSLIFGGRMGFDILDLTTLHDLKSALTYLGVLTVFAYIIWISLDFGTSIIAPASENRATRRRLISLGYLILLLITFLAIDFSPMGTAVLASILCVPVVIISLSENNHLLPVTTAPFTRKGALGKISKYFLYPGWASGLFYTLLLYGLIQGASLSMGLYDHQQLVMINLFFGILLFPLGVISIFYRKKDKTMGIFLTLLIAQFIILGILSAMAESLDQENLLSFFFWIPACMIYLAGDNSLNDSTIFSLSYFNIIIYTLIPLFISIPIWQRIRETEKQIISPSS